MPVLSLAEAEAYDRARRVERERARGDTGVIGSQTHEGALLNVLGPRTRGPYSGTGVRRPRRMVERSFPRCVHHLLRWHPMTPHEIRLEDIGALVRQWEEVGTCLTCEGTGTIQKDNPNHFHYWAQRSGVTCARCSGQGRVLHAYEERITHPHTVVKGHRTKFLDSDSVVHLVTKNGGERATRCRAFKGIPVMFLTAWGDVTCFACLAWTP